ncbi:protein RRNAD1 isoform X1 [Iris pallida]|uniref:Protein RRNAD1 isoform X1 n=1 Tax=Iris pallida TaxID=29817 RepID=A0AAX6H5J9_IRIPA|nr:protein RRNAD1 isoform X1 [Iris pallida]
MATPTRSYTCSAAAETLEWMNAIADFLRPFKPLIDAHVVNFFKDRLWELVDEQWLDCLKLEPVENLINIPSGLVQDYWPASLQEFVLTLRSLALPREQKLPHSIMPDMRVTPLGSVLSQGMNLKKKHEVEVLAAVVNAIALDVGTGTVIDVGSGQGYLAQALSFEYQLSVIAIDASLHHSTVTCARAERVRKHYAAKLRKSQYGNIHLKVPCAVTCKVLSSDSLTAIGTSYGENIEQVDSLGSPKLDSRKSSASCHSVDTGSAFVLAGLHACGDLSVNMLRTFVDCWQAKALISVGCCYNLLSEGCSENASTSCGFPMSNAATLSFSNLGKNACDLACQSAERWKSLTQDAALQNFDLHAFRAAFQMVLYKYFPEVLILSPSIGRQGKALRRQQCRRAIESQLGAEISDFPSVRDSAKVQISDTCHDDVNRKAPTDVSCTSSETVLHSRFHTNVGCKEYQSSRKSDKYTLFKEFSESGLGRLSLCPPKEINFLEIWKESQLFYELVGPYWSLRAALGQLLETYILLDRLLFLQEQGNSVEAFLFPIFDPTVSPRNVAIIARKRGKDRLPV